jgi:hypothetical protein
MKTELQDQINSTRKFSRFAKRSYEIYKEHFKSRNQKPVLTLDEFMENYRTH